MDRGWIAVDLDGTLAYYDHWRGIEYIGDPIQPMVKRVKNWIQKDYTVKIFTARYNEGLEAINYIKEWCMKHIGQELEVTATKDFRMIELWDDRCIQVVINTGMPMSVAVKEGMLND